MKEDKSLNGFIRSGHRELIPLAEFRTWIMSIRDKDEYREKNVGMVLFIELRQEKWDMVHLLGRLENHFNKAY